MRKEMPTSLSGLISFEDYKAGLDLPKPIYPGRAYGDADFMNSPEARYLRVLAEMQHVDEMMRRHHVDGMIQVFGSARNVSMELLKPGYDLFMAAFQAQVGSDLTDALCEMKRRWVAAMRQAQYYEECREFAGLCTQWGIDTGRRYFICSGAGPGIMEAANRGAYEVDKSRSIGLGISLPFEPGLNPWVTPELAAELHYFFTRKYGMTYRARAIVCFPGGYGTLDELFEVLTLRQTKKITKPMVVALYGPFWDALMPMFEAMVKLGTISANDLKLFQRVNTPQECFEVVRDGIVAGEQWYNDHATLSDRGIISAK